MKEQRLKEKGGKKTSPASAARERITPPHGGTGKKESGELSKRG